MASDVRDSDSLRRTLARIFDADDRLILAPGILVALRLILPALGARSLSFRPGEYYDLGHFPGFQAGHDALIASVVTWKGDLPPLPRTKSLLVADATHIGAAGFPSVRALDADVVVGDSAKWIAPPGFECRVAWLWFSNDALFRRARAAVARLYLATTGTDPSLCSRWISPADVRATLARLKGVTRETLAARHARNLDLRERLTGSRGPTAIAWMRRAVPGLPSWRRPDGVRVLCRADVARRRVK